MSLPGVRNPPDDHEKRLSGLDDRNAFKKAEVDFVHDGDGKFGVLATERDIATAIISIHDDPTLNPWTLRAFIIGLGLSAFGSVLAEIYYFKPQALYISTLFLAIISYVLGMGFDAVIPQHGFFRYLNPHPFNKKEHAFIVIMASAAANSALGTDVLAVQRLFYNITPNPAASIFLLCSSQLLGYGIGGLFRSVLLYPSKMLYPSTLPLVSMLDVLFKNAAGTQRKLKLFWIAFGCIFVWELFPEWIFPLLTGFSIFCLANPRSPDFTRIFGGTNGNEGLGLLSICLDWQYISISNPLATPLKAQVSTLIGYILCTVVFAGVFYGNIWESRSFPFLSQQLFNITNGRVYNQTLIMNGRHEIDSTLLAQQGLPYYAGTRVVQLLTANLGLGSTFTHLLIWNYDDMAIAWSWMSPSGFKLMYQNFNWRFWTDDGIRKEVDNRETDPHYLEMLKYPDTPNSWYIVTLVVSIITSLVIIYQTDSTLPWWGFVISLLLGTISVLFFGALYAITGLSFAIQPFVQMIGGFIHPGKPMANMYFVLYSYNSVNQAQALLRDLKIAQYVKLPPRAAFTAQIIGTLFGSILNFVLMNSIIDSRREILLSVQGTNIWSGQQPQGYNSQAITWGGLSHELFSVGKRYQFVAWAYLIGFMVPVPFWILYKLWPKLRTDYLYTPIICYYIGCLSDGISSPVLSMFFVSLISQWWLRTRHARWFANYNYILSAALDGGAQVMVFILSFAVEGASGNSHLFPQWWGANQRGNYDRCVVVSN